MEKGYRPGQVAPKSDKYSVVDEKGKKVNTADVKKGERFPPTQSSGKNYK